ncbi:MAG: glycosyltransferase [Chloroflexi bacterium]|nr:glycosyltransferase [Chloroflexota bacterium]
MRVLLIARYLQMVNHRKVMALAAAPGLELWHLAPRQWTDGLRTYHQELSSGQGYHLIISHTLLHHDIHRFIYWPLSLHLGIIKPDIIHIEEEPDSLAVLQTVVARRLWAPSAKLVLFTWQNIRRARSFAVERLARIVLQGVDHAIAGNCEAGDVLRQQGYAGPVSILPQLGVDTTTFKPVHGGSRRHTLGLDGPVIGYVGRFVPEKGLDVLARAVAPLTNTRLLLVGRGPSQTDIEALARSLGMADRMVIVPGVPHDEVAEHLNCMDVFVLPSLTTPRWKEQFGHVLIEAMACGVPVVGSSSGAIPEVIADAGLTFPEGDADALQAQLERLLNDREYRGGLARRARQRVLTEYSHEVIARKTVAIYHDVIDSAA